jgi:hypothetical protein
LSAKISAKRTTVDLNFFKEIVTNTALALDITENNEKIEDISERVAEMETNAVAITGNGRKKSIQLQNMLEDCKMLPSELEISELMSNRRGRRPTVSRKSDSFLS